MKCDLQALSTRRNVSRNVDWRLVKHENIEDGIIHCPKCHTGIVVSERGLVFIQSLILTCDASQVATALNAHGRMGSRAGSTFVCIAVEK